jgi:flavorubredoxin
MFTAIEEDKVIFTCDFLGAHYCEPTMLDSSVAYLEAYKQAMYYYYDVIFSPFKKYVNDGLDKLSQFDYQFVCPSHGPILTRNGLYRYVFESYRT